MNYEDVAVSRPEIRFRNKMWVAGFGADCQADNPTAIPRLWADLNRRSSSETYPKSGPALGVCLYPEGAEAMHYVAGFEVDRVAIVPAGMERVEVGGGRFAVYSHDGPVTGLPDTVHTIWSAKLAADGLIPREAPAFELYDERFDPKTTTGTVEIWIPVED